MADNATLARKTYDAFNERDFDQIAAMTAPDAVLTIAGSGDTFEGPEGSRAYNTMWANGFPDGMATIDRLIESGDLVVVEFTGRGTHTGTLATSMGQYPPTGRSATLHFCEVMEFRDGKVSRRTTYFDSGSLMAQLGIMAGQSATQHQ